MAQQMMKKVLMILTVAALLLGAMLAQAQTYDFVSQFTISSNPNGVWSYGWTPNRGGTFTLMDLGWTDTTYGTQDVWSSTTAPSSPSIALAVTDINHPTIFVPKGTVNTHPGQNGENPVVRWTTPASGTYQLEGWFTGNDHGWWWQTGVTTTTDVAVLRGPFEVFSGFVESYNVPVPFSVTMPLLAGETVDLTVGFGRNGSWWHDSTGLAATITKVSDLACTPPPAGMIAWWPGDGNAHDIVNANNGTLNDGATTGTGLVRQAFSLDGIDDFVSIADSPNLNFGTNDFTLDFWVKFNTTEGQHVMVEKYIESFPVFTGPRLGWTLTKMENQDVRLHLADDVNSDFNAFDVTPPPIPANTWIHVAAKRSGGTFTIYWNGVPLGSATFAPTLDLTSPASLKFGHRGNPQDTPGSHDDRGFYLNGLIDEVEIFNRALTDDEIRAIYLAGSAGKCRELAVTIDITPGGFPNNINPASRGVTPVAILTTATFNAALVDATTVLFGATGTEAAPVHSALQDVDLDGDLDLILQFTTQQTGIVCETISAALTGTTIDGVKITGTDSVRTVGCR